jgi:hypothetical protein
VQGKILISTILAKVAKASTNLFLPNQFNFASSLKIRDKKKPSLGIGTA